MNAYEHTNGTSVADEIADATRRYAHTSAPVCSAPGTATDHALRAAGWSARWVSDVYVLTPPGYVEPKPARPSWLRMPPGRRAQGGA